MKGGRRRVLQKESFDFDGAVQGNRADEDSG